MDPSSWNADFGGAGLSVVRKTHLFIDWNLYRFNSLFQLFNKKIVLRKFPKFNRNFNFPMSSWKVK